jgi:hypothetical protein
MEIDVIFLFIGIIFGCIFTLISVYIGNRSPRNGDI